MKRINIFDTTLRDGEQTPGISYTPEEKVKIAQQLDTLGVDVIEVGTPVTSEGDRKAAKLISKLGLKAKTFGLTRVLRGDVDAAIESGLDGVHIFVSTSDIQVKHALNMTHEQVLSAALDSVQYAKDHGLICEFTPMDTTRTRMEYLKRICIAVEEVGVDVINIADTVGVSTPDRVKRLVEDINKITNVPLSVHCHNDFGMAVANTLAGVMGGASQVEVTVNGLGERAGNASLEEVVMAMTMIYEWKTGINTRLLYETSQLVSRISGITIQPNKAITGQNAFAHESGIHTRGIAEVPLTFEPIDPELVGRTRRFVAGKVSGTRGIMKQLVDLGYNPTIEQAREVVMKVKELGDQGKIITDADLMTIANVVIQKKDMEKLVDLTELAVMTGTKMTPTASVKMLLNNKTYLSAETGVGPVDAAVKAIQKITSNMIHVKLNDYQLGAITGGSDATAEVMIVVEDEHGNLVSARAEGRDIVMASIDAMITGINTLLIKQRMTSTN
jgi:2-isopropylmalate synthase